MLLLEIIGIFALLYIGYEAIRLFIYTQRGVEAGRTAKLVQAINTNPQKRVLVVGDCGTVSVGVSEEKHSIVGRLATDFPNLAFENSSQNAMMLWKLRRIAARLPADTYDAAIIHIGSMDTIVFTPTFLIKRQLSHICTLLAQAGITNVVVVSPYNVGSLPLFRFPLDQVYDWRSRKVAQVFDTVCTAHGLAHVPLYVPRTQPLLDLHAHFTNDLVHPNDAGHEIWYTKLKPIFTKHIQ